MTFAELLTELARNGIGLSIAGDTITTNVPANKIPDSLKQALTLNKNEIIATMQKELGTTALIEQAQGLGGDVIGQINPDDIPGKVVLDYAGYPIESVARAAGDKRSKNVVFRTEGDEFAF